jgi:hypothetical protein
MGPGRSPLARTASGRRRVTYGGRRCFGTGMGALHRGSAGEPSRGITHPSHWAKSQDARTRTSPERDGVARVFWCADLSCGCAWGCRATLHGSAVSAVRHRLHGPDPIRYSEPRSGSQTGMIEGLTVDRQYLQQKKFRIPARNIRDSMGRTANPDGAVNGCRRTAARHCLRTDQRQALTRGPHIPSLWRHSFREFLETFRDHPRPPAARSTFRRHLAPAPKEAL